MSSARPPEPEGRVLHVITRMIIGGAQENTLESCARVAPHALESTLLSGPETGPEGSLLEETRARGVRLVVEPSLGREIAPGRDVVALLRLWRRMRAERPHIVHTHSSKAGILGRLAARLAGVPVVVHTVHGWSFHDHMSPGLRLAYVLLERLGARGSDALVVVAESDRDKGLAEGIGRPGQYRLIRSGVDLAPFRNPGVTPTEARARLGLAPTGPVVGAVGRLSPQKDPEAFVRVAARVHEAHPDASFVIVGDGSLRAKVEALAADLGIAERLVLPGLRRDVAQLLPAFDVAVFTSGWEGLPRVVPQCLAAGVPIAAYGIDGIVEALESTEAGVTVTPGDETALAERIMGLLGDPVQARAMAERGAVASREFDLDRMIADLEALYAEGLASAAHAHR